MKLNKIIETLENSSSSAALSVADHLETVAQNGREYRTLEALRTEAEELKGWSQFVIDNLS